MSRAYWMMLSVAILTTFALYMNWFAFETVNDANRDKTRIEMTVDKGKVKEDISTAKEKTQELGRKTAEGTKEITEKFVRLPASNVTHLELDPLSIELRPGKSADVSVTRSGHPNRLQLGLIPSSGSNLLVTGGLFQKGETRSTILIEAPKDAHSGTIEIIADGKAELATVTVLP